MLKVNRQRTGIFDLDDRIQAAVYEWFADLKPSEVRGISLHQRSLRWSEHRIYQVTDRQNRTLAAVLVKLTATPKGDARSQRGVRPSSEALAREHRALFRLYEYVQKVQPENVAAVRPLAYWADIDALITEHLPGKNLLSIVLASGGVIRKRSAVLGAVEAGCRAGQTLAVLHQIKHGSHPKREPLNRKVHLQELSEKLDTLSKLVSAKRTREILLSIEPVIDQHISPNEIGTVSYLHGDSYPENFVQLPDGRVYTIDTTLHQAGSIERDVARFLVGIKVTKRRLLAGSSAVSDNVVRHMEQAFLKGYRMHLALSVQMLLVFELLALVQRWIEVVEVLDSVVPRVVSLAVQRTRIDPYLTSYVTSLCHVIQKRGSR